MSKIIAKVLLAACVVGLPVLAVQSVVGFSFRRAAADIRHDFSACMAAKERNGTSAEKTDIKRNFGKADNALSTGFSNWNNNAVKSVFVNGRKLTPDGPHGGFGQNFYFDGRPPEPTFSVTAKTCATIAASPHRHRTFTLPFSD